MSTTYHIVNQHAHEVQPYYESIGHLYEYLKPETFPSLTTLDVHDLFFHPIVRYDYRGSIM